LPGTLVMISSADQFCHDHNLPIACSIRMFCRRAVVVSVRNAPLARILPVVGYVAVVVLEV
jgi:hypothetical protein